MSIVEAWLHRGFRRLKRWLLVAITLFGIDHGAYAQPFAVQVRTAIAYGPDPQQQGDIYAPVQPVGPLPTVVMIHGGGWVEGARQTGDPIAKLVAGMGLVVFNIDYRLADEAQPRTRWPAQLADAQLAVRFLRAHAEAFGVDPARVGAMGDSAGGHLAVLLGAVHTIVPGDDSGRYSDQQTDVKAVIDEFGPTDLAALGPGFARNNIALFGTPTPSSSTLQSASPLSLVGGRVAPIYILHGTADAVVPFEQSRALVRVLRARGIKPVLVPFEGGHEYEGVPIEKVALMLNEATRWMVATLNR